ncbi:MBOAT family O-acyltransferase [Enterobacter hormaechei]|uniref:MBOAT family O-acyltransferase n=1 Tax=Enterobacter hormaechei TaxID=158836 RepID=UPI0022F12ADE|nr:MBOAT family O-acyltransferase [Enterobacter hormaechei]MDA4840960.1 MBOAT family protein [Enterobacter hormaechei]
MLFNSLEYSILFLPLVVLIFFFLKRFNITLSKVWICCASLYFYTFFTFKFLPLLLISMLINYAILTMIKSGRAKFYVTLSIIFNVVSLGYFKYCDFFASNISSIFNLNIGHMNVIAPLAISFYTFQQISLSVSLYRKQIQSISLLDYCCYILFFPKLISGPITNYDVITSQINSRDNYFGKYFVPAVFIFSVGVFKKVVMSSYFGSIADQGYASISSLGALEAWITSLSYSIQLYFDFSGYTDMAIGSALLFGVVLPINFNSPYIATDLQDFWRRWHITLSTWLRNYVYIPLGGNRKGVFRTYLNLFLTFLIGGFWHGAGWNFLAWGALHGVGLVIHRYWSQNGFRMPSAVGWFVTFNYVNITWIFFRTDNLQDAFNLLNKMFAGHDSLISGFKFTQPFADSFLYEASKGGFYMILICAIAIMACLINVNSNVFLGMIKEQKRGIAWNLLVPCLCAFGVCVAVIASLGGAAPGSFIYFNF